MTLPIRFLELYRDGGIQELKRGISDTAYATRRDLHQALSKLSGTHTKGQDIWTDDDWDVLCVLDACRADTFQSVVDDDAPTTKSVASSSKGWVNRTFDREDVDLSRVGYITGNPFSTQTDPTRFGLFEQAPVEQVTQYGIETVPPERLTDLAIDAWRRRTDFGIDQLIVHYMQPHVPFRAKPEWFQEFIGADKFGASLWQQLRHGTITHEEVKAAYRDNLTWVFEDGITPLKENCAADIVLTADHGNAFGEQWLYGHPGHIPAQPLRDVPWYAVTGEDHQTQEPETTVGDTGRVDREAQLSALGYRS
jgi:hypothetical protein